MSGKLKIVRVLGNPKIRRKIRAKRKTKGPRRRAVRSLSGKWVLRMIGTNRIALWRTPSGWTKDRKGAHKFATQAAAAKALKSSEYAKRHDWIVADVMPA